MIERLGPAHALAGMGLLVAALFVSRTLLEPAKDERPFGVVVREHPLVATGERLSTTIGVQPVHDAALAEVWFAGIRQGTTPGEDGRIALALDGLTPGYTVLGTHLRRRGRSASRAAATILAGRFAAADAVETCSVRANVSAAAFVRIVKREIHARLLASVQTGKAAASFGPTARIARGTLVLVRGGARFRYDVESEINDLGIAGTITLARGPGSRIEARLIESSFVLVRFEGRARNLARGAGLGGGAVLGGLLFGPVGALLGAAVGAGVGDGVAHDIARATAEKEIRKALREFSTWSWQGRAELVRGNAASRVDVGLCDEIDVDASGVSLLLAATPQAAEPPPGWVVPGMLDLGVDVPGIAIGASDVELLVPLDLLNLLLDTWTKNGVLAELVRADVHLGELDRVLTEATTLERRSFAVRGPPMITQGDAQSWSASVGMITLGLVDTRSGREHRIVAGARGNVHVESDAATGEAWLGGQLSQLHLVCEDERTDEVVLTPCFGAVLDLDTIRSDWNLAIAPTSHALPRLAVRELIAEQTSALEGGSVRVQAIEVDAAPSLPGVLRVRATFD